MVVPEFSLLSITRPTALPVGGVHSRT